MDGVDKEQVQSKVLDITKDSSFYNKENERAEKIKIKAKQWISKIELRKKNENYWKRITRELHLKIER